MKFLYQTVYFIIYVTLDSNKMQPSEDMNDGVPDPERMARQRTLVVVSPSTSIPFFLGGRSANVTVPSQHRNSLLGPLQGLAGFQTPPQNRAFLNWVEREQVVFDPHHLDFVLRANNMLPRRNAQDQDDSSNRMSYREEITEKTDYADADEAWWNEILVKVEALTIPTAFICPITLDLMKNPFCAMDGHTYERSAITKWLASCDTYKSPKTNIEMGKTYARPDF